MRVKEDHSSINYEGVQPTSHSLVTKWAFPSMTDPRQFKAIDRGDLRSHTSGAFEPNGAIYHAQA